VVSDRVRHVAQRSIQIGPKILDGLDAHAQSQQRRWHVLLPGNAGPPFDGGLNRAQAGGVLDELQPGADNSARLLRRFWFDRVSGIRLARIQFFDDAGSLLTDVAYSNEKQVGSGQTASLPSRLEITRPQDRYKLNITYQDVSSVQLNRTYSPKAFVLENTWGLEVVDLDAINKKVTANK